MALSIVWCKDEEHEPYEQEKLLPAAALVSVSCAMNAYLPLLQYRNAGVKNDYKAQKLLEQESAIERVCVFIFS